MKAGSRPFPGVGTRQPAPASRDPLRFGVSISIHTAGPGANPCTHLLANLVRGRRVGETREPDFMPWGGAYNRLPIDATAFPPGCRSLITGSGRAGPWQAAREQLLEREKGHTRLWDELACQRRDLPWVPVDKEYVREEAE
jgi:hypothetical protein